MPNLPTHKQALLQMVAYRVIRDRVNEILDTYDLNSTQWSILGLVHDHPDELRITDVANHLAVEGTLITVLVQALVTAKYIESVPSPQDRRARLLVLTPSGKKLVSKLELELAEHLEPLASGISDDDLANYFNCLQKFIDNANK